MLRSLIVVTLLALAGCSPGLSPAQQGQVFDRAAALEGCKAEGRAAHSYRAYVACTERKGLRDITDADVPAIPDATDSAVEAAADANGGAS